MELRLPGQITTITPPLGTHCFNGGLVRAWGRLLTVYRVNRRPSLLAVSELDTGLQPRNTRILWELADGDGWPEDPRVVFDGETLHLLYTVVGAADPTIAVMWHAELDRAYRLIDKRPCYCSLAATCEKNWAPFLWRGELHAIYWHDPFTVLRCRLGEWKEVYAREVAFHWKHGKISGGAPPVWRNGLWYHFFHSSRTHYDGGRREATKVYHGGCYVFDGHLNVVGVTKEPVLSGSLESSVAPESLPWRPNCRVSAVFPCGAVDDGDDFLVSYGYQDAELRVARVAVKDVDESLLSLEELATC